MNIQGFQFETNVKSETKATPSPHPSIAARRAAAALLRLVAALAAPGSPWPRPRPQPRAACAPGPPPRLAGRLRASRGPALPRERGRERDLGGHDLGFISSDLREMERGNEKERRALFFLSPNLYKCFILILLSYFKQCHMYYTILD